MMIVNENNFIRNIVGSIYKNYNFEAAIYCSCLYMITDGTILSIFNLSGKIPDDLVVGFTDKILLLSENCIYDDEEVFKRVLYKSTEYIGYINSCPKIYEDPALRNDPVFEDMTGLKSADGARFYFMNTTINTQFIPVFQGLPSLTKADKVGIELFDLGNYRSLVKMNVFKKKLNMSYDMIYKIVNVNRSLRRQ